MRSTHLSYYLKSIFAQPGDRTPVLGCDSLLREEVAAHTDACDTGLEPALKIVLRRFRSACDHDLAPWHWSLETFYECRPEHITREDLSQITSQLLSLADFRYGSAARAIWNKTAVTYRRYLRIEERSYYEIRSQLEI